MNRSRVPGRNLVLILALSSLLVIWPPDATESNGGGVIFQESVQNYFVTVSILPPEPTPGVAVLGITIQGIVTENGSANPSLVPTSARVRVTGRGPEGAAIGPLEPRSINPVFSHYDLIMEIDQAGPWVFTLELSGALGDATVEVPLEVASLDSDLPAETSQPQRGKGQMWMLIIGLSASMLGAIGFGLLRTRRTRSV